MDPPGTRQPTLLRLTGFGVRQAGGLSRGLRG